MSHEVDYALARKIREWLHIRSMHPIGTDTSSRVGLLVPLRVGIMTREGEVRVSLMKWW